jgi:hypothetical protein
MRLVHCEEISVMNIEELSIKVLTLVEVEKLFSCHTYALVF